MPTVSVYDMTGKQTGTLELSADVFGIEPNKTVLHSAVVNYLANQRQGTQSTKTRTEVSGGGKKPWRQKGTGHARQGSTRAPQWTHGGIALGPKPRSYRFVLPKKMRRLALKSAFSSKVAAEEMLVLPEKNEKVVCSARNIPGVKTALVNTLNVYDVLNADKFIVVKDAVAQMEEVYK